MTTISITFLDDAPKELINAIIQRRPISKKSLLKYLPSKGIYITGVSQDSIYGGYKFIQANENGISATQIPNE